MARAATAPDAAPSTAAHEDAARDWLLPRASETFRAIYTRCGADKTRVLAICSAISGEGKTTLAIGLATTMAQDFPERRVLLVETNLDEPVLAKDLGVDPAPGLVDSLATGESPAAVCRRTRLSNFDVLPAGGPVTEPGRWLRSSRTAAAIESLRQEYDLVVLDVPALLVNSDSQPLTALADGVILAVRAGITPTDLIAAAIRQLESAKLLGTVLNGTNAATPRWLRRLVGA
jgi:Mrp family chromosome partitioning ATPase